MIAQGNSSVSFNRQAKTALSSAGRTVTAEVHRTVAKHGDMGSQTVSGVILSAQATAAAVKAAQAVTPAVIATTKAAWDITTTAGKVTVAVAKTAAVMANSKGLSAKVVLNNEIKNLGGLSTNTSRNLVAAVKTIPQTAINAKNAVVSTAKRVQTGVIKTKSAIKTTYTIVRGVATGKLTIKSVAYNALSKGKTLLAKGVIKSGRTIGKGVVKTAKAAVTKGVPMASKGALGVSRVLTRSDNMMIQGVGYSYTALSYGIKTGAAATRLTGRAVKTTVKGGIKAGKGIVKTVSFIRQKGLKAAVARARKAAQKAVANAGKSVVSAALNLIKAVGKKAAVPLMLLLVVVVFFNSIFGGVSSAVVNIFGGVFEMIDDVYDHTVVQNWEEVDTRSFILREVGKDGGFREQLVDNIYSNIVDDINFFEFDIVRLLKPDGEYVLLTESEDIKTDISTEIYTAEELTDIIQPIFQTYILRKYDLRLTNAQAETDLGIICEMLIRAERKAYPEYFDLEYCGQSLLDGSGTAKEKCSECGSIHAYSTCPNASRGEHETYTCSSCCWYDTTTYCAGHTDEETGETTYCDGCETETELLCSGYRYCNGHTVSQYSINSDGVFYLLYTMVEYYIDELANRADLTDEEKKDLSTTKDCYEICNEMIKEVSEEQIGIALKDIRSVEWVTGTRTGNSRITDIALAQKGNKGGETYYSASGFDSHAEWSACLAAWCLRQAGYSEYTFNKCSDAESYFKSVGRYKGSDFTDIAAGDIIFIDYNGYNGAERTGVVLGTDGEFVYVVMGNCGDVCRICKFYLTSNIIQGYGLVS